MNKSLKELLLKLGSDEKLFLQMLEKNTISEMYEFCLSAYKGDYSKEEFEKIFLKLVKKLFKWKPLSDDDLLQVSGGSLADFMGPIQTGIGVGKQLKPLIISLFSDETPPAQQ